MLLLDALGFFTFCCEETFRSRDCRTLENVRFFAILQWDYFFVLIPTGGKNSIRARIGRSRTQTSLLKDCGIKILGIKGPILQNCVHSDQHDSVLSVGHVLAVFIFDQIVLYERIHCVFDGPIGIELNWDVVSRNICHI